MYLIYFFVYFNKTFHPTPCILDTKASLINHPVTVFHKIFFRYDIIIIFQFSPGFLYNILTLKNFLPFLVRRRSHLNLVVRTTKHGVINHTCSVLERVSKSGCQEIRVPCDLIEQTRKIMEKYRKTQLQNVTFQNNNLLKYLLNTDYTVRCYN